MVSKELVTILQQIAMQVDKALQLCSRDSITTEDNSVPLMLSDIFRDNTAVTCIKSSTEKNTNKSANGITGNVSRCSSETDMELSSASINDQAQQTLGDSHKTDHDMSRFNEEFQGSHTTANGESINGPDYTQHQLLTLHSSSTTPNLRRKSCTSNNTISSSSTSSNITQPKEQDNSSSQLSNKDLLLLLDGTASNTSLSDTSRAFLSLFATNTEVIRVKSSNVDTDYTNGNDTLKNLTSSDLVLHEAKTYSVALDRIKSETKNTTTARQEEEMNENVNFLAQSTPFRFKRILHNGRLLSNGVDSLKSKELFTTEQSPHRKRSHSQHQESTRSSPFDRISKRNCPELLETVVSSNTTPIMDKVSRGRTSSIAVNNLDTLSNLALLKAHIYPPDTDAVKLTSCFLDNASNCGAKENVSLDESPLLPIFTFADEIPDVSLTISDARLETFDATSSGLTQTEPEGNESVIRLAQSVLSGSKLKLITSQRDNSENTPQAIVPEILEANEMSTSLRNMTCCNSIVCSEKQEIQNLPKRHTSLDNEMEGETVLCSVHKDSEIQNVCCSKIAHIQTEQSSDLNGDSVSFSSFSARDVAGSFLHPSTSTQSEEFIPIKDTEVDKQPSRYSNAADKEGSNEAEKNHKDNSTNYEQQLRNVSVGSVIENMAEERLLLADWEESVDNLVSEQENNVLISEGVDSGKGNAEKGHSENCNEDNLSNTGVRGNNSHDKQFSTTKIHDKNSKSTFSRTNKSIKKRKQIRKVQKFKKPFQPKSKLVLHLGIKNSIHCHDCGKNFKLRTGGFTQHVDENGCKPYICSRCERLFTRKSKMLAHFKKCTN